ncbi:MAG: single-stranded-DNA-specific exonuclease RecJ [Peptococcaceae bacterium]|nr:single-stranded-DNA-specific exonuclease RecJ [Peptococcaceae bacterium]
MRALEQTARTAWEFVMPDGLEGATPSGLHPIVLQILRSRGISDLKSLEAFLYPDFCHEHDPFLFRDMSLATLRLGLAREKNEKVLIHGDYDADGVTSAALLFLAFTRYGLKTQVYIPTRAEGYGIQRESILLAHSQGVTLIVTADCGVQAVDEAKVAHSLGIDLIITDHHTPAPELPLAFAIIDPKIVGCPYPFKDLAGVGVAYKLACALLGEGARDLLDYVAVGTVADLVPLVGENRLYVRKGLALLNHPRCSFKALMEVSGVKPAQISAGNIAYMLAPRLNAAGRLDDAVPALSLLLTQDDVVAQALARDLDAFNRERQRLEAEVLSEALAMVDLDAPALVLFAPHWPPGVIGIVASRLVERFHRPTILLCQDDQGVWRGSGRSIIGFDLIAALRRCQAWLLQCGGHPMAAGLTMRGEQLSGFSTCFLSLAGEISADLFVPRLRIQAELNLEEVTEQLLADIALLAPFGVGNAQPIFASNPCTLADKSLVGSERQHLRLLIARADGEKAGAIMFNQARRSAELSIGDRVRLAFRASLDTYKGKNQVSIHVQDFVVGREWWLVLLPCLADHRFMRLSAELRERFFTPAHRFMALLLRQEGRELVDKPTLALQGLDVVYLVTPHGRGQCLPDAPHVTYAMGSDLVYNGKEQLQLLVPKREQLAHYYRWLAKRTAFSLEEFAGEQGLLLSVAYSVCAATLHMFTELDLVTFEFSGGKVTLLHQSPGGPRRDLAQSPTYNALCRWEKEALL